LMPRQVNFILSELYLSQLYMASLIPRTGPSISSRSGRRRGQNGPDLAPAGR
jgi:hypothetical protein